MSQSTLISPTTAAVTTKAQIVAPRRPAPIVVSADNLATGESCSLYMLAGATWVVVADLSGSPVVLTPNIPTVSLAPGPVYGVTKTATAGACGVFVDL